MGGVLAALSALAVLSFFVAGSAVPNTIAVVLIPAFLQRGKGSKQGQESPVCGVLGALAHDGHQPVPFGRLQRRQAVVGQREQQVGAGRVGDVKVHLLLLGAAGRYVQPQVAV